MLPSAPLLTRLQLVLEDHAVDDYGKNVAALLKIGRMMRTTCHRTRMHMIMLAQLTTHLLQGVYNEYVVKLAQLHLLEGMVDATMMCCHRHEAEAEEEATMLGGMMFTTVVQHSS